MTIQCCVCKQVKVRGEWTRSDALQGGRVSHTYCPVCLEATSQRMEAESHQAMRTKARI